jgi:hypothetical protein
LSARTHAQTHAQTHTNKVMRAQESRLVRVWGGGEGERARENQAHIE